MKSRPLQHFCLPSKGFLPLFLVHVKMETIYISKYMNVVYMKVEMETELQIMHHHTLLPDIIQRD